MYTTTERQTILRNIRKNVSVENYLTYSEKRKGYQRVKWFSCRNVDKTATDVENYLRSTDHGDVVVELVNSRYKYGTASIVLKFPTK